MALPKWRFGLNEYASCGRLQEKPIFVVRPVAKPPVPYMTEDFGLPKKLLDLVDA